MNDKLENLKFAYALSEARIEQLEDRIERLKSSMSYVVVHWGEAGRNHRQTLQKAINNAK